MQTAAYIQLILGPMFSGKSSQLLRKIRRFEHARKKCLVVNYLHDNRYTQADEMATHDRYLLPYIRITRKAIKTSTLMPIRDQLEGVEVVGIDEGQFFEDIAEFCDQMAQRNIIVIVAALDATFERKPFGKILDLVPLAEKVYKLTAVCAYCTKSASFSKRIVGSQQIQLIGGDETYKPVCRACFFIDHMETSKQISQEKEIVALRKCQWEEGSTSEEEKKENMILGVAEV